MQADTVEKKEQRNEDGNAKAKYVTAATYKHFLDLTSLLILKEFLLRKQNNNYYRNMTTIIYFPNFINGQFLKKNGHLSRVP